MKDRIKQIRNHFDLTQQQFADKLGVSKQNIVNYECRSKIPSQSAIANICKTFNVNETWLLTGEGDMTSSLTKEQEIAQITAQLFREEDDSFRTKLISLIAKMSDEQIEQCKEFAKKLCE